MDLLLLAPDIQEQICRCRRSWKATTPIASGSCGRSWQCWTGGSNDGCGLLGRDRRLFTAADIRLLPKRQLQMLKNLLVWQIEKTGKSVALP